MRQSLLQLLASPSLTMMMMHLTEGFRFLHCPALPSMWLSSLISFRSLQGPHGFCLGCLGSPVVEGLKPRYRVFGMWFDLVVGGWFVFLINVLRYYLYPRQHYWVFSSINCCPFLYLSLVSYIYRTRICDVECVCYVLGGDEDDCWETTDCCTCSLF